MQQTSTQISPLPPTVFWKQGFLILIVLGIEDAVSVSSGYFCVCVCLSGQTERSLPSQCEYVILQMLKLFSCGNVPL